MMEEEPDAARVEIGERGSMNCVEFERELPEFLEGSHTPEQQAHVNSCAACSSLLSDLNFVSAQVKNLFASEEPSPAVWNAIETQLRAEGLIREVPVEPVRAKRNFLPQWRMAWLVPVTAALALIAGLKLYHPAGAGDNAPVAKLPATPSPTVAAPISRTASVSKDDEQLMNTVAARIPAQQARYRADLDDANAFIRDAEQSLKDDPNDIYTQQMLINAYAQKQMLYDLAVDRSGQ